MKHHTKLSQHRFSKGKFITPLNEILKSTKQEDSWFYARLPEYLWLGLIIHKYGRSIGLESCHIVLDELHTIAPELEYPLFSSILDLDDTRKEHFFSFVTSKLDKEVLAPMTLFLTYSYYPIFAKHFSEHNIDINERKKILINVLNNAYGHQTNFATDIRFLAVYFTLLYGKLRMDKENIELINDYPNLSHSDEKMRIARPNIRSMEVISMFLIKKNEKYLLNFWERVSKMSECKIYSHNYDILDYQSKIYNDLLFEAFEYLTTLFKSTSPIDNKMLVLLGIATYSYKNLNEVIKKTLFNNILGRTAIRVIIENYIMMKYLLDEEPNHDDIWTDFQFYGIGQYKLVLSRSRESKKYLYKSHVDYKLLEMLVNEYVIEETIDMDTKYFDDKKIRDKAIQVDEKELFGLYYDYDSAFVHGLWGAVRESSLLKCINPAHHYHCIPDYTNEQKLRSVWYDCVNVMNKILCLLDHIYGIPANILKELKIYEQKLIDGDLTENSE